MLDRLRRAARPGVDRAARELERGERGVALVEVQVPRVDSDRRERAHAADAEQEVLREAHVGVGDVEARGDPAGDRRVLGAVGVEQVERDASDVDAPDLGDARARPPIGTETVSGAPSSPVTQGRRQALGVGVDPVLLLAAGAVDALAEVALAVEQPDARRAAARRRRPA